MGSNTMNGMFGVKIQSSRWDFCFILFDEFVKSKFSPPPCLRRGFLPAPRLWQTGGRQASKASGSGSAPEGLLPRRESLWLGEGRRFSTFYETILFAPGDESPGYYHRCPLMGRQNRFRLALMPLAGGALGTPSGFTATEMPCNDLTPSRYL
jgi:hypothetical protein